MTTLIQQNRFRRFEFTLNEDGVLAKQKSFLRFNSNEQSYSFHDLGIDLVKKSNNEGIPTLLIIGVMTIATAYVAITNLSKKPSLSLLFFAFILVYVLVIIYSIQKYLTSTYDLSGGKLTLTFLRYKKANEQTVQFIEKVKKEIKIALVKEYNDLVKDLKPNDRFLFEPLPAGIVLSDDAFRLLKQKVNLLYNNLIFEEEEDEDLEEDRRPMKEIKDFTEKQAFIEFLQNHPEKGTAYPGLQYDTPHRVHPNDYFRLNSCTISFDGYHKFRLQMHPETNEMLLADMNDGGHATLFGIVKIQRDHLFTRQASIKEWFDADGRGSYKFWP